MFELLYTLAISCQLKHENAAAREQTFPEMKTKQELRRARRRWQPFWSAAAKEGCLGND